MAPTRTTKKNTQKAIEHISPTESDTSTETNGLGDDNEPRAESRELTAREKGTLSEAKRRKNIRDQYLRMKAIIPSIKDKKKVESKPEIMLEAFDSEASEQVTRRDMLLRQIADIQQAINNAGHKGGFQFNPDTMSNGT